MPSLREVKDRIGSVRSTLKITSAMKLVASSKLRKAQRAVENMIPYQEALARMLAAAGTQNAGFCPRDDEGQSGKTIVLAFAGNTSMCGAFNANVIKKTMDLIDSLEGEVEVWAFGRKMSEALRKSGRPASRDYSNLIASPEFHGAAGLSAELRQLASDGIAGDVLLVYNHFVSTGKQVVVSESFFGGQSKPDQPSQSADDFIIEPSREELLASLRPQVLDMKLYAVLLDSVASEHAARMVAMQTATDNAEDLLAQLTLEYNKGRQQKITSEILDLVAGEA